MNILIRPITETDLPFIFATWLKGLYHGNEFYSKIKQDVFYAQYHKMIETILPKSMIKIACLEDEPDVIIGYCVFETDRLHWIFVKKAWRKLTIAKQLLNDVPFTRVSHLTKVGEAIRKKEKWEFDPFI